jgi:glutathione-regulated potassium-efflux system ancillary protein KefG
VPANADDDLINAAEVAELLGLAHRNSVSTYRRRYPDFPAGRPAPGGGRTLLWSRTEVLAWRASFRSERLREPGDPDPRLDALVSATERLMVAHPGTELSIRQIAAEAGVPHSDLYRHAQSKEQLQELAVDRLSSQFAADMPADYATLVRLLADLLQRTRELRGPLRVMAHELIMNPDRPPRHPVAIAEIAPLVESQRRAEGRTSSVDPRVVAAAIGALAWGAVLFESRWLEALGLEELPADQLAVLARAMLEA